MPDMKIKIKLLNVLGLDIKVYKLEYLETDRARLFEKSYDKKKR